MNRTVRSLTLSAQHFLLPTTASPNRQDALKDGFGEVAVECDVSKTCLFPSLGYCQNSVDRKKMTDSLPTPPNWVAHAVRGWAMLSEEGDTKSNALPIE